MNYEAYWKLFLWRGRSAGHRLAGGHGLLPLQFVPVVVRWTRERFHAVEAGGGADHIGAQHVATFEKTPMSQRKYCAKCGGHLMTNHPTLGLVDVFAATLPTLAFTPGVHVNYAETVLPMRDGLPKLKDFPAELGGSGETVLSVI